LYNHQKKGWFMQNEAVSSCHVHPIVLGERGKYPTYETPPTSTFMNITLPDLSLIVLIGASSSGKSTFARTHFLPTEIISSDQCRALVSNDENNQEATTDAFDLVHYLAGIRLRRGLLTVIDATNIRPEDRKHYIALARQYHCIPVAMVFDLPERTLKERHQQRTDRSFSDHVIANQHRTLRKNLRGLGREGFRHVFELDSVEKIAAVTIRREPLWNNRKTETGPFDIIGDVHGCHTELTELLTKLDYAPAPETSVWMHPAGRKVIFVGDLVDRGPASPAVLRVVMDMVKEDTALCVPGNHDSKLLRKLKGKNVTVSHGLAETLAQLSDEPAAFVDEVKTFLDALVSHYVLDVGRLVVAHAGLREEMHGRGSGAVREFCLYGETTGETDEFGLPIRYNWAADYKGRAMIVYGHTPVPEAEWLNNTIDIDTGCVFGGKLTALRYPERELVSVPAHQVYAEPMRPLLPPVVQEVAPERSVQQGHDDVLDIADLTGKQLVETRYMARITVREQNAIAALEVMSRFAVDPRWLIYLPPTMSPTETSPLPDFLEHPAEAFAYYRKQGVMEVVCEEKHMGSRAVVIVTQTDDVAISRFGLEHPAPGVCYTRTGRPFFMDSALGRAFLEQVRAVLDAANFWEQFETDWVCLDAELMPWSAKAQSLIREQYAAVGTAGNHALSAVGAVLATAATRHLPLAELRQRVDQKAEATQRFTEAYRRYCRPTEGLTGLVLAPFHLLATEGHVHTNQPHTWHMDQLAAICRVAETVVPGFMLATLYRVVNVADAQQVAETTDWWEAMTRAGGEGMVVKPLNYIARPDKALIQPAVKCRGVEYLRIIYGADYNAPQNIVRLKERGLGTKRSMALKEFSLGLEAMERFVAREPLRRVHECVFAVLALESEEVDPRL